MAGSEICWCGDTLSEIASLVTILSLVVTPIFFFVKRWYDKISERKMASKNLYGELDDTLRALDHRRHPGDFVTIKFQDGRSLQHMNRSLNHDVYDSMIFSGRINFLRHELQQQIQDVFKRIKNHNKYVNEVEKMLARNQSDQTRNQCEKLQGIEESLLTDMPSTMKRLARDTKI